MKNNQPRILFRFYARGHLLAAEVTSQQLDWGLS